MRLLAGLAITAACAAAQQSALDTGGPQAERIEKLWWFFLAVLGSIFIAVMGYLAAALLRRKEREVPESSLSKAVTGSAIVSLVLLLIFIVVSVSTGKAMAGLANTHNGMTVEVTGNQWWWQVRYPNEDPSRILATANEIHIPVGRPVQIRGLSVDVIHSFWVPGLNGKIDLIPSRVTTQWIQADRPGQFRGQCAEFCGLQHAHMSLWVIAEPEDQFEAWMNRQLQPASAPADSERMHGQEIFLSKACVLCHTVRGTPAAGQNGPDLTHVGSRLTIAAGTLPNSKGTLGGWISDPQSIKPGNHMATVPLANDEVQPLIDYLAGLQ